MKVQWLLGVAILLEGYRQIHYQVSIFVQQVLASEDLSRWVNVNTSSPSEAPTLTEPPQAVPVVTPVNHDVPVVVISSLRNDYLQQVLSAINPTNQHPNTPSWIRNSRRYVFAHRNEFTNRDARWKLTELVARRFGCEIHVFDGNILEGPKHPHRPIRAYFTKHTWYRMMRYLFHTLNETEVLILEDDAVLAPDGLFMAAALLQEKRRRIDVHNIALGGHAGENKVNANPYEFMAVRSLYFQAMAYSMNVTLFDHLDAKFHEVQNAMRYLSPNQVNQENEISTADWTMEITQRELIPNLTQLEPSVGRMHHIGLQGMGYDGNGQLHDEFPIPWAPWQSIVSYPDRNLSDFYLFPNETTDTHGFLCQPISTSCGLMRRKDHFGPSRVKFRNKKDHDEWKNYQPAQKTSSNKVLSKDNPHPLSKQFKDNLNWAKHPKLLEESAAVQQNRDRRKMRSTESNNPVSLQDDVAKQAPGDSTLTADEQQRREERIRKNKEWLEVAEKKLFTWGDFMTKQQQENATKTAKQVSFSAQGLRSNAKVLTASSSSSVKLKDLYPKKTPK